MRGSMDDNLFSGQESKQIAEFFFLHYSIRKQFGTRYPDQKSEESANGFTDDKPSYLVRCERGFDKMDHGYWKRCKIQPFNGFCHIRVYRRFLGYLCRKWSIENASSF